MKIVEMYPKQIIVYEFMRAGYFYFEDAGFYEPWAREWWYQAPGMAPALFNNLSRRSEDHVSHQDR